MALWSIAQGFAESWTVTIKDGQGATITNYLGTEPLSGVIWAGDSLAALVTLTPSWLDSTQGTITVPITAAQSATLDPGTYSVEVYLADRSADFYRGQLQVLNSAGSGAAPFSYITYEQMLAFAGQASRLQDALADEARFASQLHQASLDFDRMVLARYQPVPGRSRRYLSADGTTAGPYPVFGSSPDGSPAPARSTIEGYLGTAKLLVNADILECVAHLALSIIYLGQPGRDNPYREAGLSERTQAMGAFRRALVEFDTNEDGIAEIRIDQDVTWLT